MTDTNLQQRCTELESELNRVNAELERTRAMLGPVADDEFARRVEVLADRSKRVEYGKLVCPICQKQKITRGKLRAHLKVAHREEILSLTPSNFD